MKYLTIDGTRVPALGLGTWQLAGEDCVRGVAHALDVGYRHIDTAQAYENEAEVGAGIRASGVERSEVFLTTKFHRGHCTYDAVFVAAENSLAKLDTDYIDLFLIHWPNESVPIAETVGAMCELQQQGKIRHVGMSNFTTKLVSEAAQHAPIFAVQVEFHPYLAQAKMLAQAKEMGYMLTAYSPLALGKVVTDPLLIEIGEAHGKSSVQVTLRWAIQHEPVAVIPKTSSDAHRISNLDVFDFELTVEQMAAISVLDRRERIFDHDISPEWDD